MLECLHHSPSRLLLPCFLLELAPAQAPWTSEQLAADLEQIAAVVRSEWSYHDDRRRAFGVDVDALLATAKAALPGVRSADDFARILRRFTAGLQDGHAWSFVPGELPLPSRPLPFQLADCSEGLVVTAVTAGAAGPRRGDLLLAVDGTPIEDCIAETAADAFASTPGMRRSLAIQRLLRSRAPTVRCTFAGDGGERRDVAVATLTAGTSVPEPREPVANWSLTWPRAGTALLHLHSFQVPRWREWLQARPEEREPFLAEGRARIDAIVAELLDQKATALILDLRGNGGGTDLLGIHLAERLLDEKFLYFQLSSKNDGRWSPPAGIMYGKGEHARFRGKVVALVDGLCFSTTDNFVRCLHDLHPDFTGVGRATGGGTGAPREIVVAAHSKALVGACTQRVYGPRGKLIEGRGTEPDLVVQWTCGDWLAGRDPDLEAALALLDRPR